ncbi:metallophosphoesterase family protein [Desulforamulus hydrothermalis]|uniref:Nuclease SbcCD subunit D n=1 Tax=Desulforamulus hydrothermalis Lam5 = DSM 18033 TaxID=1121428 RepID=K8EG48_9FIRM|nr:metallophosphoesterase [Desulforamulus hydrothermalis]CCO07656.1 Metallophosphoesterase [Desulforamulus hydrothermalis Lam5 = DSM 18033]SHH24664.1 DNA repair exonuclease SbcCD nuclease subunit [Desulforamulus hydrothermalis Lam5 = DSM 18033]
MSKVKFIHCSDIHLGRQRLDGKLPDTDFARALNFIVRYTIEQKADALLIAGDLFDSPNIQPPVLQQATACLMPLQQAGIPVFAIEGNHDRATLTGESPTWVKYLNDIGLLHLLTIPFTSRGPVITPWDETRRCGSYIDFKGIRLVGAGYLGAGTVKRARLIAEVLSGWRQTAEPAALVMLLHAGPDYIVQEGGGFSRENLEFLHGCVDYLALGHIHKPMHHGGWAVNPGSPEHVRLEESRYDGRPRGLAVVEIDPAHTVPLRRAEIIEVPKRRVLNLRYDCSPHGNKTKRAMEAIQSDIINNLRSLGALPEDAVRLELTGSVNLGRIRLDTEALAAYLQESLPVMAVEVISGGLQPALGEAAAAVKQAGSTREELELSAIHEVLRQNPLPGLEQQTELLAGLLYRLKEDVRNQVSAQEIRERLHNHPLVEQLLAAIVDEKQAKFVAAAKDGEG